MIQKKNLLTLNAEGWGYRKYACFIVALESQ